MKKYVLFLILISNFNVFAVDLSSLEDRYVVKYEKIRSPSTANKLSYIDIAYNSRDDKKDDLDIVQHIRTKEKKYFQSGGHIFHVEQEELSYDSQNKDIETGRIFYILANDQSKIFKATSDTNDAFLLDIYALYKKGYALHKTSSTYFWDETEGYTGMYNVFVKTTDQNQLFLLENSRVFDAIERLNQGRKFETELFNHTITSKKYYRVSDLEHISLGDFVSLYDNRQTGFNFLILNLNLSGLQQSLNGKYKKYSRYISDIEKIYTFGMGAPYWVAVIDKNAKNRYKYEVYHSTEDMMKGVKKKVMNGGYHPVDISISSEGSIGLFGEQAPKNALLIDVFSKKSM